MLTVLFLVLCAGMVHGGKSTVPPTNQSKTDYSASPTHTEIQHKFALSQFSAHISVFHTDNRIRHRQYRSANNLTNTNNTNSETSTTSYTQGYSNYTSNNVIVTKAPFILYVPGFYGEDCLNRAFAYMAANPGVYTYADAACACIGNCRPPLAPNPDAYNYYRNNVVSSSNVIRLVISNVPYIAATSVIMIAGLGGNIMALVSLIKWLPRSETNLCMASQCIADLLLLSFSAGISLFNYVYGVWIGGDVTCRLVFGMRDVSFVASTFTMVIVSLQRFTAICHPLYAKSLVTTSKTVKALIGAWMCAVVLGVWRCFNVTYMENIRSCISFVLQIPSTSITFFFIRLSSVYILPLMVQAVCYTCCCISLIMSLQNQARSRAQDADDVTQNRTVNTSDTNITHRNVIRRLKVICMLITILVIFFLCWGPLIMKETIVGATNLGFFSNAMALNIIYLLSYVSSTLNPVLYAIFSQPIRSSYRRIMCCHAIRNIKLVQQDDRTTRHSHSHSHSRTTLLELKADIASKSSNSSCTLDMDT